MSNKEKLLDALRSAGSLPFLFIGSGMSRRYLESENWENLLRLFAQRADATPYFFEKLRDRAKIDLEQKGIDTSNASALYPRIADFIEEEFSKVWYDQPQFEESRRNHAKEIEEGIAPFKIEIADYCKRLIEKPPLLEHEVNMLKDLSSKSIAGIITTNFDCFLETLFPDFFTYVGQDALVFSSYQSVGEIYKIHGCCSDPASIIINSKDYAEFDKKNAYLAAKLMTVFVEHPIVFLGYSIQDDDIQKILQSIIECLSNDKLDKLRNRLIFVERKKDARSMEISTYSKDFGGGKSIDMTRVMLNDYTELYATLLQIKSKYPTKLMRQIKRDIYEITLTNDPKSRLICLDTNVSIDREDVEYVVGFGVLEMARQGYRRTPAEDIFWDVIFDDKNYINELIVEYTLIELMPQCKINLPVLKYLSRYTKEIPPKYTRYLNREYNDFSNSEIRRIRRLNRFHSVEEVVSTFKGNLYRTLINIAALTQEEISVDSLHEYLKNLLTEQPELLLHDSTCKSNIKKLIQMYDWLKYKERMTP